MLFRRVVIHHNTCKKIATFLLLLSLCLVGRISDNGELSGETIYEYDEKDRLARNRRYDKDGKLEYGWDYLYDSFDNTIECVMYSWNSDQTLSTTMKTIAEFEYYESDN